MFHKLVLGGKTFEVSEPCFRDLRLILTAINQLNAQSSDKEVAHLLQTIVTALIGGHHVKNFKRYCWEAWKIPAPTSQELETLLNQVPDICGLTPATPSDNNNAALDWNALYWRIARVTGWTFTQIDNEMTLSCLSALSQHLLEKPLTDDLVASYLGYEYQKPRTLHDAIDEMLSIEGTEYGKH